MTYLIAEAGQNHQGSVDIAMSLIDMAADPWPNDLKRADQTGCDAIKFTKRDLGHEAVASQMAAKYDSPHSFGETYGEHRAYLELSDDYHAMLYAYAKVRGLDFIETLCAPGCLSLLKLFTPDRLKVASRDLTNLPLLEVMAETKVPIILSTGMGDERDIGEALDAVSRYHSDITLMHCLSAYPAKYEDLNLSRIHGLRIEYDYPVGYSDHSIGIMAPIAAVAMGACMVEKHITLDRTMRGSDHEGALERDGLWRMCRDVRNLDAAMGSPRIIRHPASLTAQLKLERSLATSADIPAGTIITESDVTLLSPGDGYRWRDRYKVIGLKTTANLHGHELIYPDNVA